MVRLDFSEFARAALNAVRRILGRQPLARWRVSIEAQAISRELLEGQLKLDILDGPDDHPGLYLAHPLLDAGNAPDEVRDLALELVTSLNGALAFMHPAAPPISFQDRVCEVSFGGQLGKCMTYMKAQATAYVLAWGSPAGPGGRSPGQRAFDLMRTDPEFRSAATLFAHAEEDFQQLFIVAEFARDAAAGKKEGSWKALESKGWVSKSELDRFKEVANRRHRHRPTTTTRDMSGNEARDLASKLLRSWLDLRQPT